MNCAMQHTASSSPSRRSFVAAGASAPGVAAVVSVLTGGVRAGVGEEGGCYGVRPGSRAGTDVRPMKRTPLTAMLTLAAVLAASMVLAACGSSSGSSTSTSTPAATAAPTSTTGTTTTKHGHSSKPTY